MENSVNFDNLRSITEGDAALEAELFRSFLTSSGECMDGLRTAVTTKDENEWRKYAHALKGVSLNLGAGPLSELCRRAQDEYRMPIEEKERMLAAIEREFAIVCAIVEGQMKT